MATLRTSAAQTALRASRRNQYICPQCEIRQMRLSPFNELPRRRQARYNSSIASTSTENIHAPPAPPLLAKIKSDLKAAMRAKDTPRLNVLRAMISEYNNASKTNTPIKTDIQLLSLLKKKKASSEAAAAEAKAANRQDLEEKQLAEIKVMDEYAGTVQVMSEDEIKSTVQKVIDAMTPGEGGIKVPNLLKEVFASGGPLEGKSVEKSQVAKVVNQLLGGTGR